MISGLFRVCLLLCGLSPAWLAAEPVDATADTVLAGLRQTPPARIAFTEIHFLHVLDQPLRSSGELAWLGLGHLQRQLRQPRTELIDIDGDQVSMQRPGRGTRHFSLRHAPSLQLLLQSFDAVLSGDANRLRGVFSLQLQTRPGQAWTLQLVPLDPQLRAQLPQLAIDGRDRQLRCMRIEEAHGDHSIELLGSLAAGIPATMTGPALLARCQGRD